MWTHLELPRWLLEPWSYLETYGIEGREPYLCEEIRAWCWERGVRVILRRRWDKIGDEFYAIFTYAVFDDPDIAFEFKMKFL